MSERNYLQKTNQLEESVRSLSKNDENIFTSKDSYYITNPNIPIGFFIVITTIFFIFKILLNINKPDNKFTKIIFGIYILLIIIGNLFINIAITKELCKGSAQFTVAFLGTFVPWVLIFGILLVVLNIYPGWLIPFSNTFGYLVVNMLGLTKMVKEDILNDPTKTLEDEENAEIAKALQQIYSSPSMFINEIPNNLNELEKFIEIMTKLKYFKSDVDVNQLYKYIKIKDYVAEYIWYLLGGILVTSITYNYIISSNCNFSAQEMQQNFNKFTANQNIEDATS